MAYCLHPASRDHHEKVYQIRKQIKGQFMIY